MCENDTVGVREPREHDFQSLARLNLDLERVGFIKSYWKWIRR